MKRDWETKYRLDWCLGTENPRLYNFEAIRKGGHIGKHSTMITFKESELIELKKLITKTIKETKLRTDKQ